MSKITHADGTVKQAPRLEAGEQSSLCDWLPADTDLACIMEQYGYWRNVYRAAESYGPSMIAMLMDSGALEAEQDPLEALKKLLKTSGF